MTFKCLFGAIALCLLPFWAALAEVPQMINYQGKITTPSGALIDTIVSVRFCIYPDAITANPLWCDTLPSVEINKGIFGVLLGSSNPIPGSVFDGSVRYLSVEVGGDAEMIPRRPMVSVAYAYRCLEADTAEYARAGVAAEDHDWTFRITESADTALITRGEWGLARYGNVLYGNKDSTHVNLGVACTTGASGQNFKYATVGGGWKNTAGENAATVAGGRDNAAISAYSTVGGGIGNTANNESAAVGGGRSNISSGPSATVGGGLSNIASDSYATAAGGWENQAGYFGATVGGGYRNAAIGNAAVVPGGSSDTAAGNYSFAAGKHVRIARDGHFTFAFGNDFTTSTPNAAIFYDSGTEIKVGVQTTNPTARLDVNSSTGFNQIRMRASYTPTGTSDTNGNVGDIAWDNNYFYVKTSAGWKRTALGTW